MTAGGTIMAAVLASAVLVLLLLVAPTMAVFDNTIREVLDERLAALEKHFAGDVIFYYGEIHPGYVKVFRDFIERLKVDSQGHHRLVIILNTPGGSAETVEKMVEIIRHHYDEVFFIVPDYAMSAGTIFCMSGDRIYMDYSGYLDKVEELLRKALADTISQAELLILQNQDLATLSLYEQARDLTITLLKKWLVEYKFKDWKEHQTTPEKIGQPVTRREKEERAEQIARILGDNKRWHSHGRMLGINTIRSLLRLKIEDYSADEALRGLIRAYNDLTVEYVVRTELSIYLHSRL